MLIYPQFLQGERLGRCSDEAQLHFPRLISLANGYGRLKLSYSEIVALAYSSLRIQPTREQIMGWIREYRQQHLLFVYTAADGTPWAQWCGLPKNALPRFKRAEDQESPEPPAAELEAFLQAHNEAKRKASQESGDLLDISGDFGNVPKCSEECGTVRSVVVVGEALGEAKYKDKSSDGQSPEEARAEALVVDLHAFYLARTGSNPKRNPLTDPQKKQGLARLRETLKRNEGDWTAAEREMRAAIVALSADNWAMNRDPKTSGRKSLHTWGGHLMRNQAEFIRWADLGLALPEMRPEPVVLLDDGTTAPRSSLETGDWKIIRGRSEVA